VTNKNDDSGETGLLPPVEPPTPIGEWDEGEFPPAPNKNDSRLWLPLLPTRRRDELSDALDAAECARPSRASSGEDVRPCEDRCAAVDEQFGGALAGTALSDEIGPSNCANVERFKRLASPDPRPLLAERLSFLFGAGGNSPSSHSPIGVGGSTGGSSPVSPESSFLLVTKTGSPVRISLGPTHVVINGYQVLYENVIYWGHTHEFFKVSYVENMYCENQRRRDLCLYPTTMRMLSEFRKHHMHTRHKQHQDSTHHSPTTGWVGSSQDCQACREQHPHQRGITKSTAQCPSFSRQSSVR
jgi:hypothetical protein